MGNRKQNGEGSIFQVSENKWVAKISLGQRPDGKQNIKQFSGKTEAIVKRKLREFKKSIDYTEKHIPCTDTVQAYFSFWLREYQYHKLKPLSYDRVESVVVNHINPNIGNMKMDKVTRDHIQTLINHLYRKEQLSYSSVKKVYVTLNSCYKHALISDVVIKNPCIGIILPSQAERTKQVLPLDNDAIARMKVEATKTKQDGTPLYYYGYAYLLILNTGIRMGEALSLQWDDIDFDNKCIHIAKNSILTKRRDENGNKLGGYALITQNSTKTSNSTRRIPINRSAEDALRMLQRGNTTPYVIVNNRQHPVLPSNFGRTFHTILKNAGVTENYGVHALRHTFASMLFSKRVDVKIVSQLLGHSTVKITYDTYVHLFDQDIEQITAVLD